MEYLDKTGLTTLWAKIKDRISTDAVLKTGATISNSFILKTGANKTFGISTLPSGPNSTLKSTIATDIDIAVNGYVRASKFVLYDSELAVNTNFLMANGEVLSKSDLANTLYEDLINTRRISAKIWGTETINSYSISKWIEVLTANIVPRMELDYKLSEITSKLTSVLTWKGTKNSLSEITSLTNVNKGDVWHNNTDGKEYVATDAVAGTANPSVWEELGSTQDLSLFYNAVKTVTAEVMSDGVSLALKSTNLQGNTFSSVIPKATATNTGVLRLYNSTQDTLDITSNAPLQISDEGVAYVEKRQSVYDLPNSNYYMGVLLGPPKDASSTYKFLPSSDKETFLYHPATNTLGIPTIVKDFGGDKLPPQLGGKSIGSTTQLIYLNNGVITAGEALTAITDDYINSLS